MTQYLRAYPPIPQSWMWYPAYLIGWIAVTIIGGLLSLASFVAYLACIAVVFLVTYGLVYEQTWRHAAWWSFPVVLGAVLLVMMLASLILAYVISYFSKSLAQQE